jgi:hypothetical protein
MTEYREPRLHADCSHVTSTALPRKRKITLVSEMVFLTNFPVMPKTTRAPLLTGRTCPPDKLNNEQLPQADEVKYLGIHLDRRLTWRKI